MKFSRKINQFEASLEKKSTEELRLLLKEHQDNIEKIKKGPIKQIITEYKQYQEIDEKTRNEYEKMTKELEIAQQKYSYYTSVDKTLQDLNDLGECTYFYKGTPEEINDTQEEISLLNDKLVKLETANPGLSFKRRPVTVIPSTVSSVYTTLLKRKQLIEKMIDKKQNIKKQ